MDIKKVLEIVLDEFNKKNVKYALIGGFAAGLHGVDRATVDLDFLLKKESYGAVKIILESIGYKNVFESENVAQFVSPSSVFGEIDFIIAFREISVSMIDRSEEKTVFNFLKIKTLIVEDIIGLKVQAIANNPARKLFDTADIVSLLNKHGRSVNWALIKEYYDMFGMEKEYKELTKYGAL